MSIEIPNKVHACGSLFLGNPPAIVRNFGFTALTRVGAGVFRLGLVEPIDFLGGGIFVMPAADTARMVSARFRTLESEGPDNILISAFDAAGNPADIGEVYAEVRRYPASGEPPP
ncbi:MAG TPA: hypothetical protein VJN18_11070 [Polyangiaceae bacterium]|nr:hypothetical protein [Polyangiaceae bacterium]